MEEDKNKGSFLYKLHPELNKILVSGLNECYLLIAYSAYNECVEITGIFLDLNTAIFSLLERYRTYDEKLNIYNNIEGTWTFSYNNSYTKKYHIIRREFDKIYTKNTNEKYYIHDSNFVFMSNISCAPEYPNSYKTEPVKIEYKPLQSFLKQLKSYNNR